MEGDTGRASLEAILLCLPKGQTLFFLSASASRKRPHCQREPPPPPPAESESKERRPGGSRALSVRASACVLALLVLGRQWKWLPGLFLGKPTRGLASQYSGKGPGRKLWIPRVLGLLLTL